RERMEELVTALQTVIDRHDMLRTSIVWGGLPRAVQVVQRQVTLPVKDVRLDPDEDSDAQVRGWLKPEWQRLDLRQAPLMRLTTATDPSGGRCYALLQLHHLVCDNKSLDSMMAEVTACLEGRGERLPQPVPYRRHVAEALAYSRLHDSEAFFRVKLSDVDEPTAPFGLLDVHGDGSRIEQATQALERDLAGRLRKQARRLGVTTATLFHAAWALVVACASAREDVVFGTVLLGRLQGSAGAHRTLGMF